LLGTRPEAEEVEGVLAHVRIDEELGRIPKLDRKIRRPLRHGDLVADRALRRSHGQKHAAVGVLHDLASEVSDHAYELSIGRRETRECNAWQTARARPSDASSVANSRRPVRSVIILAT